MAFVEYEFVDVEYDESAENVTLEITIRDDVLGERKHKTVLGSKHFRGRGFTPAERDAKILEIMDQEVANIHANWEDKEAALEERRNAVKTRITGLGVRDTVPAPNIPRRNPNN